MKYVPSVCCHHFDRREASTFLQLQENMFHPILVDGISDPGVSVVSKLSMGTSVIESGLFGIGWIQQPL